MRVSKQWITHRGEAGVIGLCKECHRTYGHDDYCRVGELVRLEAELDAQNKQHLRLADMYARRKDQLYLENEELKEYIIEEVGIEHVPEKWGGELR